MNAKSLGLLFFLATSCVAGASAETTGRGGLFVGTKTLKHKDWGALDSQSALGLNLDVKDTSWPVWISASYLYSKDKETVITSFSPFTERDIEATTSELHLGVKKDFYPIKILRLSFAGGPAYIRATIDNPLPPYGSDADSNIGYWLGAETIVYLGHVSFGVGYNYSQANVKLLNHTVDAGGSNLAVSFGIGW